VQLVPHAQASSGIVTAVKAANPTPTQLVSGCRPSTIVRIDSAAT
jgi:hypothetical protein